jgi:Bifunctional DNA primase/polymerase, N-terminal
VNYPAYKIAKAAAQRGWPVFPCILTDDGRKIPAMSGWQDAATTKLSIINIWFVDQQIEGRQYEGLLVGMATGTAAIVLDIDTKKGRDGRQSILTAPGYTKLPVTYTQETLSGGDHVFFAGDKYIRNSESLLHKGSGIDIRGQGGLVVLYQIPDATPLAPMPRWLREIAMDAGESGGPRYAIKDLKARGLGNSQAANFSKALDLVRVGLRDEDLIIEAIRSMGSNISEEELSHAVRGALKFFAKKSTIRIKERE